VKRWWLVIALLLSLGVNAGIVTALMVHRWSPGSPERPAQKPAAERPLPPPEGQGGGGEGAPQRVIRLADQLGLEGDQRRRFISVQGSFFAETLRLRTDQAETQRELRRALSAPSPDPARIQALLQESGRTFLSLEQALAKNVLDSRRLLNPAQERKFLKIIARMRPGNGGLGGGQGQGQQRRPRRGQQPPPPPEAEGVAGGPPPGGPEGQEGPPPGPDAQEPRQDLGNEAGVRPFRQRRQGLGRGARWLNRRFGGPGRSGLGGRRGGRAQEQETPAEPTPPQQI
jgi:Spy/CpxP family protein refolding chaperone